MKVKGFFKKFPSGRPLPMRRRGKEPVLDKVVFEFFFDPVGYYLGRVVKTRNPFVEVLEALKVPFLTLIDNGPHELFPDPRKEFEHVQAGGDGMSFIEELYESLFLMPDAGFKDVREFEVCAVGQVGMADALLHMVYSIPVPGPDVNP